MIVGLACAVLVAARVLLSVHASALPGNGTIVCYEGSCSAVESLRRCQASLGEAEFASLFADDAPTCVAYELRECSTCEPRVFFGAARASVCSQLDGGHALCCSGTLCNGASEFYGAPRTKCGTARTKKSCVLSGCRWNARKKKKCF